jgi:2-succinyl-6-hydroxy-2,4-cyclohexadiene-1-carboxylate synthase
VPELRASGGRPAIWFETKGDRSNDPVVLLHGFSGTHRTWDPLCERLSKDHFLVLPDLPGHGRSGVSPSHVDVGLESTSDAVAEVMRLAMGGAPPRKAALVGYSLGGRVALDLACRRQELLSSLVLEGTSPGIERDDEREERRGRDDALADEIERRGLEWFVDYWQETPLFATQKDLPPQVFQKIRRDRLSNSGRGLAMSLRTMGTGNMAPLWKPIESLRIPVLLVVGKRDRRYAETGGAMQRRIRGSVIEEVERAGHCVHVERPEAFADLVRRFLEGRPPIIPAGREREA